MTPIVLFSDVDDVLRDPTPSALARAAAALATTVSDQCALVLCSRYTRAELEILQLKLRITQPFIAENGAAVFIPPDSFGFRIPGSRSHADYEVVEFSRPHHQVMGDVRMIGQRLALDLCGFSDMTVEEVARARGISPLRSRLAKLSEYAEPCRPTYSDRVTRRHLARALEPCGLSILCRGRDEFIGEMLPPGIAVTFVRSLYERKFGRPVTVGLVDGTGDDTLLSRMDRQVIVQDDEGVDGAVDVVGWAEAIAEIVSNHRTSSHAA